MSQKRQAILNRLVWLTLGPPLLAPPLFTLILFSFHSIENTFDTRLFYFFILFRAGITSFYIILFRWRKTLRSTFTAIQLVLDLLLESILIGVTGHVESPYSILYIGTIFASAYIFYEKGGIVTATAALSLLGMIVFIKDAPSSNTIFLDTPYRLLLHAIAFYAVGIVSGLFFSKTDEARIGFSKLKILHEDIVKNIPSGVLTIDLNGEITSFNQSAFLITGILPLQAIGKPCWDIFLCSEIREKYDILLKTGISQRFEGEMLRRNFGVTPDRETHCFLGATISPLRNDEGATIGVIGIFQDLTPLKIMEEEMAQKRRLAIMGEMAAGMAHEIRNPLASIAGSIELLKDEPSLRSDNRRLMEIALKETDRLNAIITAFLLYAKPKPPQKIWIAMGPLLGQSMALIQKSESAGLTEIALKISDPSYELFVDPDQFRQVFWNLATNAFSAMPTGGVLTVTTQKGKNKNDEETIAIRFHDTGTGISKEDLPKIFDPFFTTKSSGSGLGLPIVQRIIEQHNGTIGVMGNASGTIMTIEIPVHPKGV